MQVELLLAIKSNNLEKIRNVLKSVSADVPLTTYLQKPLHMAVKNNNKELIKCLVLEFKADVNCYDSNGWSPLSHIAIEGDSNKYEIAQFLISLGADVDFSNRDSGYYSPLDLALENNYANPIFYQLFSFFTKENRSWEKKKSFLWLVEVCKTKIA